MIEFRNTSSYSQGDSAEVRAVPKSMTADCGGIRIMVHHHIHYPKTTWLLSTHPAITPMTELRSPTLKGALNEATDIVRTVVRLMAEAFGEGE